MKEINEKDFEKLDTAIEIYESRKELEHPQDYEDGDIKKLDDSNEMEMNDPIVQATFTRSRHNSLSFFIISQDYYELPKKTICAIGNIYRIFKSNIVRDVPNLYQDKASMNMTFNKFKYLTKTC